VILDVKKHDKDNLEVPEWTAKMIRFFYLGIGIFLLTSSLMLLGCSSAGASDSITWQPATNVISAARAREIIGENSSVSSESTIQSMIESMKVAQLSQGLLMVDFNSPMLTGIAGGRYAIYDSNQKQIFNRYLPAFLPSGVPTVQLAERTGASDYPCLVVNTLTEPANAETDITQLTLCYDGGEWKTENRKTVPISSF
jgi:hypothetical protein